MPEYAELHATCHQLNGGARGHAFVSVEVNLECSLPCSLELEEQENRAFDEMWEQDRLAKLGREEAEDGARRQMDFEHKLVLDQQVAELHGFRESEKTLAEDCDLAIQRSSKILPGFGSTTPQRKLPFYAQGTPAPGGYEPMEPRLKDLSGEARRNVL